MDISHITAQSLFRLITLAEQKEELLGVLAEVEDEILKTLQEGQNIKGLAIAASPKSQGTAANSKSSAAKSVKAPAKVGKTSEGRKPAKAGRKGITPEGRARIAAAATARWAAHRAAKAAAKATVPAKVAKARRKSKA